MESPFGVRTTYVIGKEKNKWPREKHVTIPQTEILIKCIPMLFK
jgi:hypothetical protein